MLGKLTVRAATAADYRKYTHYRPGGAAVWCGATLPARANKPGLRKTSYLHVVTCPWCRDVIRKVVADWDREEAAMHAHDLGGEAGGA